MFIHLHIACGCSHPMKADLSNMASKAQDTISLSTEKVCQPLLYILETKSQIQVGRTEEPGIREMWGELRGWANLKFIKYSYVPGTTLVYIHSSLNLHWSSIRNYHYHYSDEKLRFREATYLFQGHTHFCYFSHRCILPTWILSQHS